MNIGALKLKLILGVLKLRRAEFGARMSLDLGYLSRLLSGERQPSLELAVRIMRETNGQILPEDWQTGYKITSLPDHTDAPLDTIRTINRRNTRKDAVEQSCQ